MKHNLIFRILVLLFFLGQAMSGFAQSTGKIAGKLIDKKTGETLIGVSVKVTGTNKGVTTDVEGRYSLSGLEAASYTIEFSYVGYPTKKISDVLVKAGQVTNLDVSMEESSQELKAVVVTATIKQESVNGLYTQQKAAVSMSSGVVAEQIRRSPDRNTSEVLKRVSGTSIQDGKFVVVRGLADRYNTALINNSILPSSEPDRRAFSFDVVPSNLVDKVVIHKTASPDLPGDFSGGVTQVITKDVPDAAFMSFGVSTGYNTQSTFKSFKSSGRSSTDFLGFDNGDRQLPSNFPASRSTYVSSDVNNKVKYTRLLNNPYGVTQSTAAPIQSYQLNFGNVKSLRNDNSFGSVFSLTYRNGQTYQDASRATYDGIQTNYQYNDAIYRYSATWGALANLTYKTAKSKYSIKNLYNQTFEDNYVDRSGTNINQGNIVYSGSDVNQKSLLNSQLEGSHSLGRRNLKIDWNLNYSLVKRDQPDLRNILYSNTNGQSTLVDNFTRRFFSGLNENIFGGSASVSYPFDMFGQKSNAKFGVLKQSRFRDFNARVFLYEPASSSEFDQSKSHLPKEVIFNQENISRQGYAFNEITNNTDSYEGETDLNAGYLMLDNRLNEKLRLVWGLRVEEYYQNIKALNNSGSRVNGNQEFLSVLPSLNLSYALTSKANIRLAGSKTVSRPELRELAPFAFINQEENTQISGNPSLKIADILNADLRFEYYPSGGEAFTATVFYKDFTNPIEQVVASSANYSNLTFTYNNAKSAFSYGFELDFRKKMTFLSSAPWAENLIASANVTVIKSEVDLGQTGQVKRQLQGQSPYLINGGFQYTSPKSGVSVNALYNRVGKRIWRVGSQAAGIPDFYERSRDVVDLQLAKRLLKGKAELKLNVSDILNQNQVMYQNFDGNTTYSKSDIGFFDYKSGTTFTLGLTYDLRR